MIAHTSDDSVFNHKYRLRHLNTGRLVTVQEITYNGEKVVTLGLAEHLTLKDKANVAKAGDSYEIDATAEKIKAIEENTLFMFVPTNVDDDSRIKNSSCAKIQHVKSSNLIKTNLSYRAVHQHERRCNL